MVRKRFKVLALVFVLLLVISSATYANPVHRDIFTEVSGERIFNHIEALASTDNARVTGFDGEHAAADYIARELESYGLNVERQKFPILAFLSKGSAVSMISPPERSFPSKTFTYTPPTSPDGITAELVYVGLGSEADFAGLDLTGKIALIKRGSFTFYAKTQNAAKAGAAGVIIFNNQTGMISGTLGAVTDIPAVAITNADGEYLVNLLNAGQKATVKLVADTELKESFAQNVIGTLKAERGYGDAKTFVVGAHYDGVDTPAANDNASGTSTMLEVARVLSTQKLAHDVKFIAFGAEEVGLIGSEEYVASLDEQGLNNIAGMINM
ncbi:MAG TPA: M28 family peptidase, partial [Verrucomicrobiae bacterium]|nr:M28 family peptidase [Verrucomicrobiae bacterium]